MHVALLVALAVAPPPADPPLEFEAGRTAAQYLAGALVAGVGVSFAVESNDSGLMLLAATPALVGGATCLIGRGGQHDGACWATILGAYLGAATIYPLAYLGYRNEDETSGQRGEPYYGKAILGAAIGWFLVQPLGATLGWHFSRSRRPTITAGLPPRAAPRLLQPPRRRDPHALRPAVAPLLSLRF